MENESLNKKVTFQKVLLFLKGNCPTVFMKKCFIGIHQLVKIKTGKGLSFKKKNLTEWHDFNISCWKYGWFPADFSFKILGLLTRNQLRTFSPSSSLWAPLKCFRSKPPSLPQNKQTLPLKYQISLLYQISFLCMSLQLYLYRKFLWVWEHKHGHAADVSVTWPHFRDTETSATNSACA